MTAPRVPSAPIIPTEQCFSDFLTVCYGLDSVSVNCSLFVFLIVIYRCIEYLGRNEGGFEPTIVQPSGCHVLFIQGRLCPLMAARQAYL